MSSLNFRTARPRQHGWSGAEAAAVVGGLAVALLVGLVVANLGLSSLLVVAGLFLVVVVLRWPIVGFLAFAASISVENIAVIEGIGGVATASRLLGMLVFGAWGLGKLLRRESMIPLLTSSLFVTSGLLFAFALASTLWARVPQAAFSGTVQLAQFIALGLLTFDLARSWERVDLIVKALVVGGTLAALLTIEQAVVGGASRAGDNISGGVNQTAMLLVTMIPFAFYLLRSRTGVLWKILGMAYIGAGVTATVLTYSRMNLLVLPVILGLLSIHTLLGRRGRLPILMAGAVALMVAAYTIPTTQLQARLETIVPYVQATLGGEEPGIVEYSTRGYHLRLGLAIARDEPLLGAGFRNYGYLFRDEYQFFVPGSTIVYQSVRSPHSSHVGMLADLGGVGFGLWLAVLLCAGLIPAVRAWLRSSHDADAIPFLVSQAITYAVGLQVAVYGMYTTIDRAKHLWVLLGLAVAVWRLVQLTAPGPGRQQGVSQPAPFHVTGSHVSVSTR